MATQLLMYKSAVPISRTRHAGGYVEMGADYAFSGEVNCVPLMTVEFPLAAREFAIVFAGQSGEILPAVILGVRDKQNLFVSSGRTWGARYVPAFVRRYPFIFTRSEDRLMLCIDEEYPGFNREGRGQPLFADEGKPSPYLDQVMQFLQQYQREFTRTRVFCNRLDEMGLLEPMVAQVPVTQGEQVSMGGFLVVSRAKLKALPADKLAELAKTDQLELVFLHLQSMRNFDLLQERMHGAPETMPDADGSAPVAQEPAPAADAVQ